MQIDGRGGANQSDRAYAVKESCQAGASKAELKWMKEKNGGNIMRSSGILLPVSSLPSPYGIGSLGEGAYRFVDFLADSGQRYWQILPIGPTSFGDSPYQSFSAFASNPYFIDLALLREWGLLTEEELRQEERPDGAVDYGALFKTRFTVLRRAASRMRLEGGSYAAFLKENAFWLGDYALFMAIKAELGHGSFQEWPQALRMREEEALRDAGERLAEEVEFWGVLQFLFAVQWERLKRYANKRGVLLIGDLPIYVSTDSADLWAEPQLFQVDERRRMTAVSGCPPDAFSKTGQLWGNPLYDWAYHRKTGYAWWIRRLRHAGCIYDMVRIDHFRGFASYCSIPAGDEDALRGVWKEGPGNRFISAIKERIPMLRIIAEDLGLLTEDVHKLLAASGFPGMKVLQFAFGGEEDSDYLPHKHVRNSVVYTGTHDNSTSKGWSLSASEKELRFAGEYLGIQDGDDFAAALVRAAMASVCDTAVIPMADWLGLSDEARINTPSTVGGNWNWRMDAEMLTPELAAKIRRSTAVYGRDFRRASRTSGISG